MERSEHGWRCLNAWVGGAFLGVLVGYGAAFLAYLVGNAP